MVELMRHHPQAAPKLSAGEANWHTLAVDRAAAALDVGLDGLTTAAVAEYRTRYGSNVLPPPHRPSDWRIFANQFRSPLVGILVLAAAMAFGFHEWRDGVAIVIVIMVNALIGWRQETQSGDAVFRLLQLSSPSANVIRDQEERNIPLEQVVVGDIVQLESGDRVPADGRWTEVLNIRVDESSLTGEAVPTSKHTDPLPAGTVYQDQTNMGWRGTTVVGGRGRMLVTAVGTKTRYGGIVANLESVTEAGTPFQKKLDAFSRRLFVVTIGLGVLVFILGWLRHLPIEAALLLPVSLIVAVIPEGLPVVITMAMAWGMWAMAKRHAIVRKLMAVETLGAVTVVATDKTGTVTFGEMTTEKLWINGQTYTFTGHGYSRDGAIFLNQQPISAKEDAGLSLALRIGLLNNDSRFIRDAQTNIIASGDPTELALIVAGEKGGWTQSELETLHPRLGEIPFDTALKHMITWHQQGTKIWGTLKGAPAEVLQHCHQMWSAAGPVLLTEKHKSAILGVYEEWAKQSYRGLAVATVEWTQPPTSLKGDPFGKEFVFVGLFGLADVVRPEVPAALRDMRQAGVRTIMLTGDHQHTAIAIAQQAGFFQHPSPELLIDGGEMSQLDDQALMARLKTVQVASRLTPEQKLRIARLLRQQGEIVAMTGDGINDVPAIVEADVGVAVGKLSSDAAKEAADVVLADGNYTSIVSAITEGRRIYRNVRRATVYLLASNFGELGLIVIALLAGLPLPLLPTQIIWLNALTDPFLGIALAREPISALVMKEPPHNPQDPLITRTVWHRIYVAALTIALSSLAVFIYARASGRTQAEIYSLTLTTIAFGQWVLAMTVRSSIRSTFSLQSPNRSLLIAFIIVGLMQALVVYIPPLANLFHIAPLSLIDWLIVLAGVVPIVVVEEVLKLFQRRQHPQWRTKSAV